MHVMMKKNAVNAERTMTHNLAGSTFLLGAEAVVYSEEELGKDWKDNVKTWFDANKKPSWYGYWNLVLDECEEQEVFRIVGGSARPHQHTVGNCEWLEYVYTLYNALPDEEEEQQRLLDVIEKMIL